MNDGESSNDKKLVCITEQKLFTRLYFVRTLMFSDTQNREIRLFYGQENILLPYGA